MSLRSNCAHWVTHHTACEPWPKLPKGGLHRIQIGSYLRDTRLCIQSLTMAHVSYHSWSEAGPVPSPHEALSASSGSLSSSTSFQAVAFARSVKASRIPTVVVVESHFP